MDYELDLRIKNAPLLNMMRAFDINTPAELARRVGLSPSTIGDYINLKKAPYLVSGELSKNANKLCDFFGVSVNDIWPEDHLYDPLTVSRFKSQVNKNQLLADMNRVDSECPSLILEASDNDSVSFDSMLHGLTERESRYVKMKIVDGMTFQQIGDSEGISSVRSRQIVETAFRKLRNPSNAKKVIESSLGYGDAYSDIYELK